MTQSVAILQESAEFYRIPFFDSLNARLGENGVGMKLWVPASEMPARSESRPYLAALRTYGSGRARWSQLPKEVTEADLVVQPQQIRSPAFVINLLRRRVKGLPTAFWGHGKCFDPRFEKRLSEKLKRWLSVRVDWWFAYNDLSARIVRDLAFPEDRITSVMNSTDTEALRKSYEEVLDKGLDIWRKELGIGPGPVGVFLGRLYFNKRVDFTLAAAEAIRERIPSFELIVIGDGEDRGVVEAAATEHSWIHYVGPKRNNEKVPYMAMGDVLLNPGVVGLVINDAMAMGLPTMTTDFPTHSPEIDYLKEGRSGLISRPWDDLQQYAQMVIDCLETPGRLAELKKASLAEGRRYSAELMAERFAEGIVSALDARKDSRN